MKRHGRGSFDICLFDAIACPYTMVANRNHASTSYCCCDVVKAVFNSAGQHKAKPWYWSIIDIPPIAIQKCIEMMTIYAVSWNYNGGNRQTSRIRGCTRRS